MLFANGPLPLLSILPLGERCALCHNYIILFILINYTDQDLGPPSSLFGHWGNGSKPASPNACLLFANGSPSSLFCRWGNGSKPASPNGPPPAYPNACLLFANGSPLASGGNYPSVRIMKSDAEIGMVPPLAYFHSGGNYVQTTFTPVKSSIPMCDLPVESLI